MDKQNGQLVATLSQPVSLTTAFDGSRSVAQGASVSGPELSAAGAAARCASAPFLGTDGL